MVNTAMSCLMAGRADVVESVNVMNLETLQPDVEGAVQQAACTASLVDKIGITPQQQHVIALSTSLYMQLLRPVTQERQQLQAQLAVAVAAGQAPDSIVSCAAFQRPGSVLHVLEDRQEMLDVQQQQAARLQMLLQKEFFLRMAGMAQFVGCLSWHQFAKAVVMCW